MADPTPAPSPANVSTIIQKLLASVEAPWFTKLESLLATDGPLAINVLQELITTNTSLPAWLQAYTAAEVAFAVRFLPIIQGLLAVV